MLCKARGFLESLGAKQSIRLERPSLCLAACRLMDLPRYSLTPPPACLWNLASNTPAFTI
ncbi:hypothetical protein BDQ94DRAFT_134691 [Aspergillus welwitschiae]|uniref:Uncharacterized protein n=1 Tax=Aspergillus welwitschiae TaxID=1341132 RepID=A0A3F3QHM8_9EURO|nr:hypothetical protein BDQ94DRAFT_134691 [Aspergillus welwitschiae]RDH38814.1 hypothetical protein BDQ94DRAFT_134691 [Aspergillus welwitschiae]